MMGTSTAKQQVLSRKDDPPNGQNYGQRLRFEMLLSNISARFINLSADQVDNAIEDAQRQVCEYLDLDLSTLWQLSPDHPGSMFLTHRHVQPGFPPLPEVMDCKESFPWALEKYLRGESLVFSRLADAPPEAALDVEQASRYGVKSFVSIPLSAGRGPTFGLLNFVVIREERDWSMELVARLKLIAEIFANALARKHTEEALRECDQRLSLATTAAHVGLWTLEADGRHFWVDTKTMELFALPPGNRLEFDCFIALVHPEDRERIRESITRAQRSPELWEVEYRILRPDGMVRWLIFSGRLYTHAAGGLAILTGVAADITGRKELEGQLRHALEELQQLRDRLQMENVYLRQQLRRDDGQNYIVGDSEPVRRMLSKAKQVAPTDSIVLITGETGTGKELLAQAIHDMSPRRAKTMVTVNCAALPAPLIEGELFGREKGAYTGAMTKQIGRFELAHGSTLFLDEIGDLPLDLQTKLLRVLQDGRFERLGSPRTLTVDARVIAATNHDLMAMVRSGKFREDLFHRLNVFPIEVLPLRSRVSDIPFLVWRFVQEFNKKMGKSIDSIPREVMDQLKHHPWPGNVRELRNQIERAMIMSTGRSLKIELAGVDSVPQSPSLTLEQIERKHICDVLERVQWRIRGKHGAAEILGVIPTTLHSRMKKLGLSRPNSR